MTSRLSLVRFHRLSLVLAVLAGCSSPLPPAPQPPLVNVAPAPATPAPPRPAVAATPDPLDDDDAPFVAWAPHACKRSVWPHYYPDDDVVPPVPLVEEGWEAGEGGRTLDDKAAALAKARKDEGVCDTRHRDALEAALLKLPVPEPGPPVQAWDRKTPLQYRELVRGKLALTADEERQLERDGLVVPARLAYADYTRAYYDIHRGELPVYISVDSILHAVYASHDQLLARLEQHQLSPHLDRLLGAMHCGLPVAAKTMPPEIANDVDLYLTVARSLLAGDIVPSELGKIDREAQRLVRLIHAGGGLTEIELFGRPRSFDVSQYTPRGHYASDGSYNELTRYFEATMWLSRVELNLVSRGSRSSQPGYTPDPTETPREAVVALALVELAERTGAMRDIAALDQAWAAFAGKREDVAFAELSKLRAKAGITHLKQADVASKLRAAIGDGYQRTTNVHPMPNVPQLPVIATMIGPRLTSDNQALYGLIDERGPELQGAELGYMLGHDRALAHVRPTPEVAQRLRTARDRMIHAPIGDDMYSHWLEAIRALSHRPQGALPAFMDTTAFADLRLDSAIAAYAQLRHNHVLIQSQVYDQGGCEIPDGYVEPAIETYKALAEYAQRGRQIFAKLDPKDASKGGAYFKRLERIMNVLVALSREELANKPLSPSARRFLSMVVEQRVASAWDYSGTFPVATYDGWYIDLFPDIDTSLKDASFVADYATYNRNGQRGIHYVGAKHPRLGLFVVDAGGGPRLMVGPVANAFQHTGPLDRRLTDGDAPAVPGDAPWAKSYTIAAVADPDLRLEFMRTPSAPKRDRIGPRTPRRKQPVPPNTIRIDADRSLGDVTLELLDHHFTPMTTVKVIANQGRTDTVAPATPRAIEAIRVRVGRWQGRLDLDLEGYGRRTFGTVSEPPEPKPDAQDPARP